MRFSSLLPRLLPAWFVPVLVTTCAHLIYLLRFGSATYAHARAASPRRITTTDGSSRLHILATTHTGFARAHYLRARRCLRTALSAGLYLRAACTRSCHRAFLYALFCYVFRLLRTPVYTLYSARRTTFLNTAHAPQRAYACYWTFSTRFRSAFLRFCRRRCRLARTAPTAACHRDAAQHTAGSLPGLPPLRAWCGVFARATCLPTMPRRRFATSTSRGCAHALNTARCRFAIRTRYGSHRTSAYTARRRAACLLHLLYRLLPRARRLRARHLGSHATAPLFLPRSDAPPRAATLPPHHYLPPRCGSSFFLLQHGFMARIGSCTHRVAPYAVRLPLPPRCRWFAAHRFCRRLLFCCCSVPARFLRRSLPAFG